MRISPVLLLPLLLLIISEKHLNPSVRENTSIFFFYFIFVWKKSAIIPQSCATVASCISVGGVGGVGGGDSL